MTVLPQSNNRFACVTCDYLSDGMCVTELCRSGENINRPSCCSPQALELKANANKLYYAVDLHPLAQKACTGCEYIIKHGADSQGQ